jgi:hypothetical protein
VEGTTEEVFVNQTLRPHLLQHQLIDVQPVKVETSRLKDGGKFGGGSTNWTSLQRQLRLHCQDGSALITTMLTSTPSRVSQALHRIRTIHDKQ